METLLVYLNSGMSANTFLLDVLTGHYSNWYHIASTSIDSDFARQVVILENRHRSPLFLLLEEYYTHDQGVELLNGHGCDSFYTVRQPFPTCNVM